MDLRNVSPEALAQARELLKHVRVPPEVIAQRALVGMPIDQFASQHYYVENGDTIKLFPHQIAKFNYAFNPLNCPPFGFQTILNSTIKKSGKALALNTPIPTPTGWTQMGALSEGDQVIDTDGQPCTVTHVTDTMYDRQCYRLWFSNGEYIVADIDHQWLTADNKTITTKQLIAGKRKLRIKACAPISLPEADLPIDPFTLGACLAGARHDLLDLPERIPIKYRRASLNQRQALLKGLASVTSRLSADGKETRITVPLNLVSDLTELICSLGYVPRQHAENTVAFKPNETLIKLKRAERIKSVPVRCITVDSPTHTYLAGATFIPTHNTAEAGLVCRWVSETWGGMNQVYTVANDKEQNRGRIYGSIVTSIKEDPLFDKRHNVLVSVAGFERWRVIERELQHLPTASIIRAIAGDHEGEAGSNPTLTAWTEIWALRLERDKRLWAEMTPVPTRPRSIRYVETYAGYKGESNILWDLWQQAVRDGYHLTINDMPEWPFEPDDDEGHIPFYANLPARLFAYIDQGELARRMPWQQGERGKVYYDSQAYEFRGDPLQYERLHRNMWIEKADAFIPIQWWLNCYDSVLELPEYSNAAIAAKRTPAVVGADGAVSGDCTGLVLVTRHPIKHSETVVREAIKWDASPTNKMDYRTTIEAKLKEWAFKYNVIEVAYDPYQLHHLMTDLRRTDRRKTDPDYFPTINTREFVQGTERRRADKRLYDCIRDQQIHHDGLIAGGYKNLTEHIQNSGREMDRLEDTRLRICKLDEGKIDLTVALSMANHRALELLL